MTLDTIILDTLDDMKAQDTVNLDVSELTSVTDNMIITTGTSSTHLQAIATNLVSKLKQSLDQPVSIEGLKDKEWILIDTGECVVHIMSEEARNFYQLEKLWTKFKSTATVAV